MAKHRSRGDYVGVDHDPEFRGGTAGQSSGASGAAVRTVDAILLVPTNQNVLFLS